VRGTIPSIEHDIAVAAPGDRGNYRNSV